MNYERILRTNCVSYRYVHLSHTLNVLLVIQVTHMNVRVVLHPHLHAQRTLRVDDVLVLRFHFLLKLHNNELRTYFADQLRKLSLFALSSHLSHTLNVLFVIQVKYMNVQLVLHVPRALSSMPAISSPPRSS